MNLIAKLFCSIFLAFTFSMHTQEQPDESRIEKLIGCIGQSTPVYLLNKYILSIFVDKIQKLVEINPQPASEKYNIIAQEAQQTFNIPYNRRLPIQKVPFGSLDNGENPNVNNTKEILCTLAACSPQAILLTESLFDKFPYGINRSNIFHEVVHEKYHDVFMCNALSFITLIGSFVLTYKATKHIPYAQQHKIIRIIGSFVTSLFPTWYIDKKYHYFVERRADIKGLYATQCYRCVTDSAQVKTEFEQSSCYLSADETQQIADKLKTKNLLCAHHKQEQSSSTNEDSSSS